MSPTTMPDTGAVAWWKVLTLVPTVAVSEFTELVMAVSAFALAVCSLVRLELTVLMLVCRALSALVRLVISVLTSAATVLMLVDRAVSALARAVCSAMIAAALFVMRTSDTSTHAVPV